MADDEHKSGRAHRRRKTPAAQDRGKATSTETERKRRVAARVERGVRRKQPPPPDPGMPPVAGWPLQCLGSWRGFEFFLDAAARFLWLPTRDLEKRAVYYRLCGGRADWLREHYAKRVLVGGVWQAEPYTLRLAMLQEHVAHHQAGCGIFNPYKQLREAGAWRHRNRKGGDQLAVNTGNGLVLFSYNDEGSVRRENLGLQFRDGFAYAATRPITWPDGAAMPSVRLTDWIGSEARRWRWRLPLLEPMLLIGALALAPIGGALPLAPLIGFEGTDRCGLPELLRHLRRMLGDWLVVTHNATDQAIFDVLGADQLAVLIDPHPTPSGREAMRRRPDFEAGHITTRLGEGLRFTTAEGALALNWQGRSDYIGLRLDGPPPVGLVGLASGDACGRMLPALLDRSMQCWRWLRSELIAHCCALMAGRDGVETTTARLVGTLWAGWWMLGHDDLPDEADCDAFGDELDVLLLAEHEMRTPPHLAAGSLLLDMVPGQHGRSVRETVAAAAGLEMPEDDDMVKWIGDMSEATAIQRAQTSETARQNQREIGRLGFKVVGDRVGERMFAIALGSVPARDELLRRNGSDATIARMGGIANTLLQAPGARRSETPIRFHGLGKRWAVLLPLMQVIGDMWINDED